MLHALRRRGSPLALLVIASFLGSLLAPLRVRADDVPQPETTGPTSALSRGLAHARAVELVRQAEADASQNTQGRLHAAAAPIAGSALKNAMAGGLVLPTAATKGVSHETVHLPQGAGKVQGLGESFSAQLSTGIATYTVPFAVPAGRGGVQPSLSLGYSSAGGHGVAGVGWDIGVPYVARQTDRGLPKYNDPPEGGAFHPEQDRFAFNGGQELVPICLVAAGACSGALADEVMPTWANGWQYFRPRVEGSFQRFFWSPDHTTWRVEDRSGGHMELGVPLDGSGDDNALETNPDDPRLIFRWNIVRQYDAHGDPNATPPRPLNVARYAYRHDGGLAYVSDIYYTPPTSDGSAAAVSSYAHHVKLAYDRRTDPASSYRRGWLTRQNLRLAAIAVASREDGQSQRQLVRRIALSYEEGTHASLLASVQLSGRCAQGVYEDAAGQLPYANCPGLAPVRFSYSHVQTASTGRIEGYEPFDETIRAVNGSPPFSLDDENVAFLDANADGLPDVFVTTPASFGGNFGLFRNGVGGPASFAQQTLTVQGVLGETAKSLLMSDPSVVPLDVDGDGLVELLHLRPLSASYTVYRPVVGPSSGWLAGRAVRTIDGAPARLDLAKNSPESAILDVDGDGLLDVVQSGGLSYATYFNLGRYPRADGLFGTATRTGPDTAQVSQAPAETCVPHAGLPLRLSDSELRTADMNGDGFPDLVLLRHGGIRYFPGRGNGYFGTGPLACPAGQFDQLHDVVMTETPDEVGRDGMQLGDVNGDGLDDLVYLTPGRLTVWLNADGEGWTAGHTFQTTPSSFSYAARMRIADINGSGTRDLVWGDARNYKYIDVAGGQRPWLLTRVENGLGAATTLEYATSTELMLAAQTAGNPWASTSPVVLHVVRRVTQSNELAWAGAPPVRVTTEYEFRDPVYDGRQREVRGFRETLVRTLGDAQSPTSIGRTRFLLGECVDETPNDSIDDCGPEGRYRDNRREALKGLPVETESFDEQGRYLSSEHSAYTLQQLYEGLDGRVVRFAYPSTHDELRYDVAAFDAASSDRALGVPEVTIAGASAPNDPPATLHQRATQGTVLLRTEQSLDLFGILRQKTDYGCVAGCAATDPVIRSVSTPVRIDDGSGWSFRTQATWVEGVSPAVPPRHETRTTYDANGDVRYVDQVLAGTLSLDRFHVSGATVAPTPASASRDGVIRTKEEVHDGFGNLVFERGADGHCASSRPVPTFADYPVEETVFAGRVGGAGPAGCGDTPLTTRVIAFDRGLGVPLELLGMAGDRHAVRLDGLGRLSEAYEPDPAQAGVLAPQPSLRVAYDLATPSRPYSRVLAWNTIAPTPADMAYRETIALVDGLGVPLATLSEADRSAGDRGDYVISALGTRTAKGLPARTYEPNFGQGSLDVFDGTAAPPAAFTEQRFDPFGRVLEAAGLDGKLVRRNVYHALSSDAWDATDIYPQPQPGPAPNSPSSKFVDGHGREVDVIDRVREGGSIAEVHTTTVYLPTGEPVQITRARAGAPAVTRWMAYDSLGRMVLNVEPNTSRGFVATPTVPPSSLKAWRYAYDDANELVGTSDARGCGENFHYDAAGRLVAEDVSPCEAHHVPYSPPNLTTGDGTEVFHHYDTPDATAPGGLGASPANFLGRLVSTSDRAAQSFIAYDGRGRTAAVARRIAPPTGATTALATRYAPRVYVQAARYDAADRPIEQSTGSAVGELAGTDGTSRVFTSYSRRGTVREVGSSYGQLVVGITRAADGQIEQLTYGDLARTSTSFTYDVRRRVDTVVTQRGPPSSWTEPTSTYTPSTQSTTLQRLLESGTFRYDDADNPVAIEDHRQPDEWPDGAKPTSRRFVYDELFRLVRAEYTGVAGVDRWVSPTDAEDRGIRPDPRRARPAPHLAFDQRIQWQAYTYDALGNVLRSDDDASGFLDRSVGAATYGTAADGPYQLRSALGGTGTRGGNLATSYDAAGNLGGLVVARQGPCLPVGSVCSARYAYDWDETGRLARARRWDLATPGRVDEPLPTAPPSADLHYAYDASDERVLKSSRNGGDESHSVYVFDSLELRGAHWTSGDYERTALTEVPYLFAHDVRLARVAYGTSDLPSLASGRRRVFLELPDHLGSSALVVDHETSELVEASTYQPYGADEADYRPERWGSYREDHRFTGKEEDSEVGLAYFGKRYLAPALGRWVSADPLTVHGLGADLNGYAYVHGRVTRAVDPTGLSDGDFAKGIGSGLADAGVDAAKGAAVGAPMAFIQQFQEVRGALHKAQESHTVAGWNGFIAETNKLILMANPAYPVVQGIRGTIDAVRTFGDDFAAALFEADDFKAGRLTAGVALKAMGITAAAMSAADGLGGCPCFSGDTVVDTADGPKPIDTIAVGDSVWARDPVTDAVTLRPVDRIFVTPGEPLVAVAVEHVNGRVEAIRATHGHPFWVPAKGWIVAESLAPGDELVAHGGQREIVRSLAALPERETVYNLEVRDLHTYFVGRGGVWVHNACSCGAEYTPASRQLSAGPQPKLLPTRAATSLSPGHYPVPDPPMSVPPVRYEPTAIREVERMRRGKGPTTKATHGIDNIEAHHRQQIPISEGGVMDALTQQTHRGPGTHSRHNAPSQLSPAQRAVEIRNHWKQRGSEYVLPGEGI